MSDYDGKVVLVVNTASQCGFTPQFAGLEELWNRFQDQGLAVLGFPCNQFGGQEPGDAVQIGGFCQRNYGVTFPMFEKIDVNGPDAHPLYQWLRTQKSGLLGDKVRWNFTKFLVGRDGQVIKRYGSTTKPEKIAADIERALSTSS
ncbi:glutathione peroxidase [Nocardioides sp.]|uniref:glutathione peroxidase n=1 Tax=Nocardioides sp. TaxID=35761 RepID=UPI002734ABDC|nr:glutathione peroxidase [Nocardioides sp.]MDP3892955.1 glutathione peroxidase [Nocardioides sp.]